MSNLTRSHGFLILLLWLAAVVFLIGCAKEEVYENVYEGLHQREQIVHPSDDPVPPQHPSYDEYKKEREKTLPQDDS